MAFSITRSSLRLLNFILTICHILAVTYAQVGTITQDLTTLSAFPLQKACAQECFVQTAYCPNDYLGSKIGCAVHTDCDTNGWQAKNDCYCRQDLQVAAQSILTSCISRGCSAGDDAIDASTAGSIYAQYCKQKGYPNPTAPAVVPATTTGPGGSTKATGGVDNPTTQTPASSSSKISTTTIIAIVVGVAIGLAFLAYGLRKCGCLGGHKQTQHQPLYQYPHAPSQYTQQPQFTQQPIYPPSPYPEPYHPKPHDESEVSPDDSVSMVGGPARPAPTLVSAAQGYPRGW
jgi:hypothetical protein